MASKLDELMDLAETMKDRAGELDYEDGSPSDYYKARAALQDALKAVVEDAERYLYLRNRSPRDVLQTVGDAAGCWIDCEVGEVLTLLTGDDADAAIDAARKP